ncbi:hypothetical protein GCM10010103_66590 [Streptomyces paradoxus]
MVAHIARLKSSDGSEPVYVVVVRDGITRVVSAWGALYREQATPEKIADRASAAGREARTPWREPALAPADGSGTAG